MGESDTNLTPRSRYSVLEKRSEEERDLALQSVGAHTGVDMRRRRALRLLGCLAGATPLTLAAPRVFGTESAQPNQITSDQIADGTIRDADISPQAGIALSKLALDPLSRSNHTGAQLASTLSDLDVTIRGYRLDQLTAPQSPLDLGGQRVINVADATAPGDVVTKGFLAATTLTLSGATFGSSGVAGTVHIGLDGSDGALSFSGTTMPTPKQRLRLSHPSDPRGGSGHLLGGPVDFYIVPYSSGMAIEFKGIVECWVEDWSIHNNNRGGGPDAEPARFWVGCNRDTGAVFLSAYTSNDEETQYGEIVSQRFDYSSHGDLRFVVRNAEDGFSFRWGLINYDVEKIRFRSNGSVLIGSEVTTALTGRLVVIPSAPAEQGIVVSQTFPGVQTADLFQALNPYLGVLARVNKDGYYMSRKSTRPNVADMVNGETAFWTDPATGDLKVTSKIAGQLKEGTVRVT